MNSVAPEWFTVPGIFLTFVGTLFYALWKGWLVPGSTLDRITKQWEDRLDEAREREREWRTVSEHERETSRIAVEQVSALMDGLKTVEHYVRAIPAAASRRKAVDK